MKKITTAKELAQLIKDVCFEGDEFMFDSHETLEEIVNHYSK